VRTFVGVTDGDWYELLAAQAHLEEPFFLPREQWATVPEDFARNIVQGKTYDLELEPGAMLWRTLREAIASTRAPMVAEVAARYGPPQLVAPRLGQGTFRVLVTDVYQRRCAMTGERTLPVLEAAHIQPYTAGGRHSVRNGLLLRSDLHTLFDRGYLTVTPEAPAPDLPRWHNQNIFLG
jgi:putative restriction endonuclease